MGVVVYYFTFCSSKASVEVHVRRVLVFDMGHFITREHLVNKVGGYCRRRKYVVLWKEEAYLYRGKRAPKEWSLARLNSTEVPCFGHILYDVRVFRRVKLKPSRDK